VEVFGLLSDNSIPPPAWLEIYHGAVQMFRQRHFKEAAEQFKSVQEQIPGGDFLCELYLSHCESFQAKPPPENWDGSMRLSEK
jgi:hypothetical protein